MARKRRWGIAVVTFLVIAGAIGGAGKWAWPRYLADPVTRGSFAYERGDFAEAAQQAKIALKADRNDRGALRLLARASARTGREPFALDIFDQLGRESLEPEDLYLVGRILVKQGRLAPARKALEIARDADPEHAETAYELGRLYMGTDRSFESLPLSERLVRKPGWKARGEFMKGLLLSQLADPAGASAALSTALKEDPLLRGISSSPEAARKLLARELLKSGHPAEARAQMETVLKAGPDQEASWILSRALLRLGDKTAATAALEEGRGYSKDHPMEFEPAAFLGSARCAECHRDIHRIQQHGRHSKTFRPATDMAGVPFPAKPVADPYVADVSYAYRRRPDGVEVTIRRPGSIEEALISYAVGSGDRGMTPVGRTPSGAYYELRMSHYGDIDGWDCTSGHPEQPGTPEGFLGNPLTEDSVRRCLDCHTTNWRAARDGVGPESADRGIGCERCHGPGENHLAAIAAKFSEPAIGRPRLASAALVTTGLCAQCHSPRGRSLSVDDPTSVRFQATTLTWSRCFTQSDGKFGCVTCHNPHRDADTSPSYYEAKCLTCHTSGAREANRAETPLLAGQNRVACPVNPREGCIDCHMPSTKTAVPHTVFTDHYIRVRRKQTSTAAAAHD